MMKILYGFLLVAVAHANVFKKANGGWSPWSNYLACSTSCGGGKKIRTRSCTNPTPSKGGNVCAGDSSEIATCNLSECPINGGWSDWSDYLACSASCGSGTKTRTRSCTNPTPIGGGNNCPGLSSLTSFCNLLVCPINGGWSDWSGYLACSASCGGGTKQRRRFCTNPAPNTGGNDCAGDSLDTAPCNLLECSINGGWSDWSNYLACSASCGSGTKTRTRSCTNPAPSRGGNNCAGDSSATATCNLSECPINGGWSDWSDYLACSTSCGGGTKKKTRSCTNPAPSSGGNDCFGDLSASATCNLSECLINGGWSDWSDYLACSASCGSGTKTQTRSCTSPAPSRGGNYCAGDSSQTATCNLSECPINGGWSPWSNYLACTASCGSSTKKRTRSCTNPAPSRGGNVCAGNSSEIATCILSECPINGDWSDWSDYLVCSASCGNSTKIRMRSCTNPSPSRGGNDCDGDLSETAPCNLSECPINGGWSDWSDYSACSVSCGGGTKKSMRSCTNPAPSTGGNNCAGDSSATATCNLSECPTPPTFKCPDGWVENAGNCYLCQTKQQSYQDSLSSCESYGGSLASIKDQAENDFITKKVLGGGNNRYWIGLDCNKNKNQRKFEWLDGTPFMYTNWYWRGGEPNNSGGNEECVHMYDWGEWNDSKCFKEMQSICKIKKGTTVTLTSLSTTLLKPTTTNSLQGDNILKSKRNLKLKHNKKANQHEHQRAKWKKMNK